MQGALVDEAEIERQRSAAPARRDPDADFDRELVRRQVAELVERLGSARRPVVLAGSGVRTAGAAAALLKAAAVLGAPVVTAWNAHDLLWEEHPLYAGRPGTVGDRAGNFAVQNADLLISVGCRLNIRQIGYEFAAFARAAWRVVVDIDALELRKPTVTPDLAVHGDARFFLDELERALRARWPYAGDGPRWDDWLSWCHDRRLRYPDGPAALPRCRDPGEPLRLRRRALGASWRRRHRGVRQRFCLRGGVPGVTGAPRPAAHSQLRYCRHGLRPAGGDRRLLRGRRAGA